MRRDIGRWRALANGLFVLAVLGLGGFGVFAIASRRWSVQPTFRVRAQFATIAGLEAGHRVRFQGMDAGVVEGVIAPKRPGAPVELRLRIDERLRHLVRTDSLARIASEGVVGAKFLELTPGLPDAPAVAADGLIRSEEPIELGGLVARAHTSLQRLDDLARSASQGLEEINVIAASIREGKGSLGKFVQDDAAYQNLVDVSRRAETTIASVEDNMQALKHTWPLSRYFDGRAFYERERVLYKPGAQKDSRALRAEDLFEPGRAVLTPLGQTRLDDVGRWFRKNSRPKSEVVIAAFTDEHPELAEVLTQEQADTVCKYLVDKHGIGSAGWFRSRKVAAVGFGTHVPPLAEPVEGGLPSRRVEIIVFTPQT